MAPATFYRRCNEGRFGSKFTIPGKGQVRPSFNFDDIFLVITFYWLTAYGRSEKDAQGTINLINQAERLFPGENWVIRVRSDHGVTSDSLMGGPNPEQEQVQVFGTILEIQVSKQQITQAAENVVSKYGE